MTPEEPTPPAGNDRQVAALVDHLFRREAGRLVSILTRHFGVRNLHLAEDVIQDALMRAMQTWPFTGVPDNPSAWLLQTARNRALDLVRRGSLWAGKQEALVPLVEDCLQSALTSPPPVFEDEIRDSQLRMMFVCCQPGLPTEAQVALVLKTLCGFGEREIAAAFLSTEAAIAKRLVRARSFLRESGITTDLPTAAELEPESTPCFRPCTCSTTRATKPPTATGSCGRTSATRPSDWWACSRHTRSATVPRLTPCFR